MSNIGGRSFFLITGMGLLSFLFGSCSKLVPSKQPPEITAETEAGGFVDLGFAIRSSETLPDGSRSLHAYGVHHGRNVGIIVVLGSRWEKVSLGSPSLIGYRGTVTYRSLGGPSDALIQVLDELYDTKLMPASMRLETVFTGISLQGEPAYLGKGPTSIKLFFEPGPEDRYAELFTDIDLAKGVLQIHEKDPDYRPAVIKALRTE